MGKPVRIIDLARNMIETAGFQVKNEKTPWGEIEIKIRNVKKTAIDTSTQSNSFLIKFLLNFEHFCCLLSYPLLGGGLHKVGGALPEVSNCLPYKNIRALINL